jgi:hypothetical protein
MADSIFRVVRNSLQRPRLLYSGAVSFGLRPPTTKRTQPFSRLECMTDTHQHQREKALERRWRRGAATIVVTLLVVLGAL